MDPGFDRAAHGGSRACGLGLWPEPIATYLAGFGIAKAARLSPLAATTAVGPRPQAFLTPPTVSEAFSI